MLHREKAHADEVAWTVTIKTRSPGNWGNIFYVLWGGGGGSVRLAPALITETDLEGTLNPATRDNNNNNNNNNHFISIVVKPLRRTASTHHI